MKNSQCKLVQIIGTHFQSQRRLLLTGTPLQVGQITLLSKGMFAVTEIDKMWRVSRGKGSFLLKICIHTCISNYRECVCLFVFRYDVGRCIGRIGTRMILSATKIACS